MPLFWEKGESKGRERLAAKGKGGSKTEGTLQRQGPSAVGSPRSFVSWHPFPPHRDIPVLPGRQGKASADLRLREEELFLELAGNTVLLRLGELIHGSDAVAR